LQASRLVIETRLPALGMTTSEEIKRDLQAFWNVDNEAVTKRTILEIAADPRTEAALKDYNSKTNAFSYYVKYNPNANASSG
jgi:hypothetical protein